MRKQIATASVEQSDRRPRTKGLVGGLVAVSIVVMVALLAVVSRDDRDDGLDTANIPDTTNPSTTIDSPDGSAALAVGSFNGSDFEKIEPGWNLIAGPEPAELYRSFIANGPSGLVEATWTAAGGEFDPAIVTLRRSSDGQTWETTETFEVHVLWDHFPEVEVVANDAGYLFVGPKSAGFSSDGVTWIPMSTGMRDAAATATSDEFIAVVAANGQLNTWRSANGTEWSMVSAPASELPGPDLIERRDPRVAGVASNGTTIVAVIDDVSANGGRHEIWRTTRGDAWTQVAAIPWLYDITHGPAGFVALANPEAHEFWHSAAGSDWRRTFHSGDNTPDSYIAEVSGIVAGPGGYLVIGLKYDGDGNADERGWRALALHSGDGRNWTETLGDLWVIPKGAAPAGTAFVVRSDDILGFEGDPAGHSTWYVQP